MPTTKKHKPQSKKSDKVEVEFGIAKGIKTKGAPIGLIVFLVVILAVVAVVLNYKTDSSTTTTNLDGSVTTTTNTQTLRKTNP